MLGRALASSFLILIVWMVFDFFLHRYFLAPLYKENANLWRPFEQMNVALICVVTLVLVGFFVVTYVLLIGPKSLRTGITFGALVGLAFGVSSLFTAPDVL